jgi:hypothetical protein
MPPLSEYRKSYYEFSGKASDSARNLALAGIAVVWIFKIGDAGAFRFPRPLVWALCLFALALALDLLHYTVSAITWGSFHWFKERGGSKEGSDLKAPRALNWVPLLLWIAKIAAVAVGYVFLACYLWRILFSTEG